MRDATAAGGGLSPPTRGSHPPVPRRRSPRGSIPAHTGKPRRWTGGCWTRRVYPRPHGEAVFAGGTALTDDGLSPPTRGSLDDEREDARSAGSIPAHTGKPPRGLRYRDRAGVYPRPHGEATNGARSRWNDWGLSPPTRGSRHHAVPARGPSGSIPAHTGKPPLRDPLVHGPGVYPRPHGEAVYRRTTRILASGLSPPTRGSRRRRRFRQPRRRSIPAHTGKPAELPADGLLARVYPRPHGEAISSTSCSVRP